AQGERISVLDEQYDQAVLRVQQTSAALEHARADLAAANQRFTDVRTRLADQVVDAYVHGGSTSLLAQLLHSDGRDLAVRQEYVRTATADEQQTLDALRAAR